jgi:uncharacterized protein YaaN involved in tellurite resistance
LSNQLIFDENQKETTLTAKEQLQIEECCTALNMADSTAVIDYGSDIQKKLSELSSRMLANLNSQSLESISNVLDTTLRYLSCVEEEPQTKKGLFFRKPKERSAREKYQDAEKNVDRVAIVLQQHQIQLMIGQYVLPQALAGAAGLHGIDDTHVGFLRFRLVWGSFRCRVHKYTHHEL